MNCEECRQLLTDYLGNELEPSRAREIHRHLTTCSSCQQEYEVFSKLQTTLKAAWPDEGIPQHLVFKQQPIALPRRGWRRHLGFTSGQSAILGIAAALMISLSVWVLSQTRMEFGKQSVRISFGALKEPVPDQVRLIAADEAAFKQLQTRMEEAVLKLHQEQSAQLLQSLVKLRADVEANRKADMTQVARGLKYLEETQSVVWKEAVQNSSNLDTLARDLYVRTSSVRQ